MSKTCGGLITLLFTCVMACGAPTNPLIGKWKLDVKPGAENATRHCYVTMDFSEKSLKVASANGQVSAMAVTYVAAETRKFPTTVFVMTNAGISNHTNYVFSSRDEMKLDAVYPCPYHRQ